VRLTVNLPEGLEGEVRIVGGKTVTLQPKSVIDGDEQLRGRGRRGDGFSIGVTSAPIETAAQHQGETGVLAG
jgi:hypothetical protein